MKRLSAWLDQPLGLFERAVWRMMDEGINPYTILAFMAGMVWAETGSFPIAAIAYCGIAAIIAAIKQSKD